MVVIIALIFSFSMVASGSEKVILEMSHAGGNLAVYYHVLNSGKHVLMVTGPAGTDKRKMSVKPSVDLNIKADEVLSVQYGFQCTSAGKKFVYAVVSKARAKEKEPFQPERAWSIDEKKLMLNPISNRAEVTCTWSPDGDGKFPFK